MLGQEDPLEKGMATHPSISALRIPWTEEPGGLQSMGVTTHTLDTTEQLTVTFSQAEMRNMFLETGSKDLVIKREKTWLNCILCNRK